MNNYYFFMNVLISFLIMLGSVSATLVDNGDGTVTDDVTGLMWLKTCPSNNQNAKNWHDAMQWANDLVFAGHEDWRLPSGLHLSDGVPDLMNGSTNNEWGYLYITSWGNPANVNDITPMEDYQYARYWTSTEHPADDQQAVDYYLAYDDVWASVNRFSDKHTLMRYTAVRGVDAPAVAPQCNDTYDNDGDGLVDLDDDECSSENDNSEHQICWKIMKWGPLKDVCLVLVIAQIAMIILISWLFSNYYYRRKEKIHKKDFDK